MIRKTVVEGGAVSGIPAADPRITAFKGIPFAAPPVGENRWRAPQRVIPWEGERLCWSFPPISMQHVPGIDPEIIYTREWNVDPEIPMDEDSLYVNVWTPAKTAEERLPVFVWYFGGGFIEGNTAEMEFDCERIARRGIVVVTVNYRLTVFGFLAHPELTREQGGAPTNFGLLDQQYATRWVQRNIAAFGGDPDNITIGGQSAGAGSVISHLTSPQSEGLCQKAVLMSGFMAGAYPARIGPTPTLAQAEELGVRFFEHLGVKTLSEARALDAVYVRDKTLDFDGRFGPSVDGVFLPANATDSMLQGRRLGVPLMISRTTGEFLSALQPADEADLNRMAREYFGPDAEEFLEIMGSDSAAWEDVSRCSLFEAAARAIAKTSGEQGISAPIYCSVFDAEIPGWDHPGTFHSVDLWFWFETLAKCWRPFVGKHYDLARLMCNYLANFIRSGDPNGDDADGAPMPRWEPHTEKEPNVMVWGETAQPKVEPPSRLMQLQIAGLLRRLS